MKLIYRTLLIMLYLFVPLIALGDTIEESVSDSVRQVPEIKKNDKWYNQIWKYRGVESDSILEDSLKVAFGKNYWKWAILSGKLDLRDDDVEYPKFVKFCLDVYNWGSRTFNTYDTAYVVGTGKKWKLMLKNDNWFNTYHLMLPTGIRADMHSDVACNIGGSISYMAASLGYMYNIDNLFGGERMKHKKWEFQFTCALIAFDAYYSKNTGSTNLTRLGSYTDYNLFKSNYNFSGLKLESYGIDLYYFFNNKKYSQSAAYSYSKYQKKSAGSAIAGVTISRQDIRMDFNDLPVDVREELPQDKRNYHIKYNDYCLMVGYGYNWVFRKNWLLNVTGIPCLGFNHNLNVTSEDNRNILSLNFKAKIALVYNHNNFFYSLNGKADGHLFNGSQYKLINSVENIALIAGFRF